MLGILDSEVRRARRRYGDVSEGKLERWLGGGVVDQLLRGAGGMTIPVPIMGLPLVGYRGMLVPDYGRDSIFGDRVQGMTGFTSLADLMTQADGPRQEAIFNKTGLTGPATAASQTLWGRPDVPVAGAAPAAPPGGTLPTRASAGSLYYQNAQGTGNDLRLLHAEARASNDDRGLAACLVLYDYLFGTTTAANPGTGSISVTGTQDRYTGAASTSEYAAGNFISNWVTVVLAATAHNITYTYKDQDDGAGEAAAAITGRSAAANTADFTAPQWCVPMNAGDVGVRDITAIQFSASPATGQVAHFIGHPLALLPVLARSSFSAPGCGISGIIDGVTSVFNLVKIQASACLALMELTKANTQAIVYNGKIVFAEG